MDDEFTRFERIVMSYSRMFEKIGGLYTVIFSLGLAWKYLFQRQMLHSDILGRIYYAEKYKDPTKQKPEDP